MKKVLSLLLVTVLLLSLTAVSVSASEAKLELKAGELVIVDPTDPDPDLPGVITGGGKNMNFGTRTISVNQKTYHAVKTGTVVGTPPADPQDEPANYQPVGLVIEDARGDGTGIWHVKVKVSEFAGSKLPGFQLNLDHVAASVVGTGTAAQKPVPVTTVALSGGAVSGTTIFSSNAGATGSPGKWGGNWQPNLVVQAATASAAVHTATVTWEVGVTP